MSVLNAKNSGGVTRALTTSAVLPNPSGTDYIGIVDSISEKYVCGIPHSQPQRTNLGTKSLSAPGKYFSQGDSADVVFVWRWHPYGSDQKCQFSTYTISTDTFSSETEVYTKVGKTYSDYISVIDSVVLSNGTHIVAFSAMDLTYKYLFILERTSGGTVTVPVYLTRTRGSDAYANSSEGNLGLTNNDEVIFIGQKWLCTRTSGGTWSTSTGNYGNCMMQTLPNGKVLALYSYQPSDATPTTLKYRIFDGTISSEYDTGRSIYNSIIYGMSFRTSQGIRYLLYANLDNSSLKYWFLGICQDRYKLSKPSLITGETLIYICRDLVRHHSDNYWCRFRYGTASTDIYKLDGNVSDSTPLTFADPTECFCIRRSSDLLVITGD